MATFGDVLPFLIILVALAAFVSLGVRRLMRMRARPRQAPPGPIPVPPEEIELAEGGVRACLRCGATRVRPANLSEGGIPGAGEMFFWICGRCGHRGPALEFADTTAYREFVKGLQDEGGPATPP